MIIDKKHLYWNIVKWVLLLGLILLIISLSLPVKAQLVDDLGDESKLYAESKQVNQFFRRFNGEEDEKGNRYYPSDKHYRSNKLRKKFIATLFDEGNAGISHSVKKEFAEYVLGAPETSILDFHGGSWFAEVNVLMQMNGTDRTVTFYMELEKNHLGYKWVISNANADWLNPLFGRDTARVGRFLHPMSHELDFMNLRKAFDHSDSISQFASKNFRPDHLSILLYEIKRGTLKFKSVVLTRFHFFQIKGWYFEISAFNRSGYNTGWLISNLVRLKDDKEKDMMKRYLYHGSN